MTYCDRDIGNTNRGGCSSSIGQSDVARLNSRYTTLSTPNDHMSNLSVIHSNCQSAMNKRSEISALVDSQNPHILALTEFGASENVGDGELGIESYSLYRGNHSNGGGGPGKGVGLYVKDTLNHSACPVFDKVTFDSTWCTILLSDSKRLLVGVVYRSPNSTEENNKKMIDILRIT